MSVPLVPAVSTLTAELTPRVGEMIRTAVPVHSARAPVAANVALPLITSIIVEPKSSLPVPAVTVPTPVRPFRKPAPEMSVVPPADSTVIVEVAPRVVE
jgi:hypothetical protein